MGTEWLAEMHADEHADVSLQAAAPGLFEAAEALGRQAESEAGHARQVTHLALSLFDQLQPLHELGPRQRDLLLAAGLLHDIGWIGGQKGHHKRSRDMIMAATELPLDPRQRLIVANVARYHRKALPRESHRLYAPLTEGERQLVCLLGGLLRVADGLDRSHRNVVAAVRCRALPGQVTIRCRLAAAGDEELDAARAKSDLLARALDREVIVEAEDDPRGVWVAGDAEPDGV